MFSLQSSWRYDQTTFYKGFLRDLGRAHSRVIIDPFIIEKSMAMPLPTPIKPRTRSVCVIINTKLFEAHEQAYKDQVVWAAGIMQAIASPFELQYLRWPAKVLN